MAKKQNTQTTINNLRRENATKTKCIEKLKKELTAYHNGFVVRDLRDELVTATNKYMACRANLVEQRNTFAQDHVKYNREIVASNDSASRYKRAAIVLGVAAVMEAFLIAGLIIIYGA